MMNENGNVMPHTATSPTLPSVGFRAILPSDMATIDVLISPEVEGEWNSFDDPRDEMLNGANYGGGSELVTLEGNNVVGIVTWIQVPYTWLLYSKDIAERRS